MVTVGLALVAGACAASTTSSTTTLSAEPAQVRGYAPSPTRSVGTTSLPDHSTSPDGVTFPFRAPEGELLVVYFGYLSCPDICPVSMNDLAAGLTDLGPLASRVEVAFVTVDIERDTGERINEYLAHFFPGTTTHSLRAADPDALGVVSSAFGAQWQIDPHEPGANDYGVAHSGSTYVVDDQGRVVWEWPFGTSGPDIAVTINQLFATIYPGS